jgi:uracil-DNA glycosylase family 4
VSERVRLLVDHLRNRRDLGEQELFVEPGGRAEILARAVRLDTPGDMATSSPAVTGGKSAIAVGAPLDSGLERLAREGSAADILEIPDLARLRSVADACRRCQLHETRTRPVFADGTPEARVMCVGEAPGQKEDETGLPFVGRAGQLLDRLLTAVGLGRDRVFICNVLKCRPPGNRNPLPEEIEQCSPFLLRQLELVDPAVVIAFGTFAARTLLGSTESLGRLRQQTHLYRDRPLVVTYHPAALLRNPGWIRPTWEDLQRMRSILDGAGQEGTSESPEGSN